MSQRRGLGEFEVLVLAAILQIGEDAYGSAIHRAVREAGRAASLGAVYTTLYRLTERGLITAEDGAPTPVRGGRAKRLYRLTSGGSAALRQAITPLSTLLAGTDLALGPVTG